jgi:hypothetical protein
MPLIPWAAKGLLPCAPAGCAKALSSRARRPGRHAACLPGAPGPWAALRRGLRTRAPAPDPCHASAVQIQDAEQSRRRRCPVQPLADTRPPPGLGRPPAMPSRYIPAPDLCGRVVAPRGADRSGAPGRCRRARSAAPAGIRHNILRLCAVRCCMGTGSGSRTCLKHASAGSEMSHGTSAASLPASWFELSPFDRVLSDGSAATCSSPFKVVAPSCRTTANAPSGRKPIAQGR